MQRCRLRKICSLSTQHTNYGYIASHILVSWNKDKHNMQYEKCQYIVWEMHCFKRFFLIKLWEMHVNILILIIIYLIIRQVLLFMRIWEMISKNHWFLIKFRATYLCSITLFMAIPGYFKMHIAWIIYLLFLICRYPFIHQPFNELY